MRKTIKDLAYAAVAASAIDIAHVTTVLHRLAEIGLALAR